MLQKLKFKRVEISHELSREVISNKTVVYFRPARNSKEVEKKYTT